jgi:hypothetical protein
MMMGILIVVQVWVLLGEEIVLNVRLAPLLILPRRVLFATVVARVGPPFLTARRLLFATVVARVGPPCHLARRLLFGTLFRARVSFLARLRLSGFQVLLRESLFFR